MFHNKNTHQANTFTKKKLKFLYVCGSYSYHKKTSLGFICYEFIVFLPKLCVLPPQNTARLVLSIASWQHKSLTVQAESHLISLYQTHEVE